MASPTFLGLVASGSVYSPWPGSSVASPLTMVTSADIPIGGQVLMMLRLGPDTLAGSAFNGISIDSISDDAPGPGAANDYEFGSPDGNGAYCYDFGEPIFECFPSFNIGNEIGGKYSGMDCIGIYCIATRFMPAGTTITIAFTPATFQTSVFSATVLAWGSDSGDLAVFLSSRSINPALVVTLGGPSLGSHTFDELFINDTYLIAHVFADDAAGDGSQQVDGSQTIDDDGTGVWTKVDSGGFADMDDLGGMVYSVFVADVNDIDLTQPMVSFAVSGLGVDDGAADNLTFAAGVVMYRVQAGLPPAPADAVLRNGYYLRRLPGFDTSIEGSPPVPDDGDPTAAEGIVVALPNGALEMGQTWTRLDG